MKKRFGKVKKFIAMLMVGVTLSSSVFYSYSIPAKATGLAPAAQTIIEALMTLFGYSLGYGRSSDGFSSVLTPDTITSAVNSALSGTGAVELGNYGSVDFSDAEAVMDFIRDAYTLTASWINAELYSRTHSKYDYVSYKNSGVSSTKTMNEMLGDIVTKYETDGTAALQEDLQQTFTVISGGASSGDDDDDDEEKGFTPLAWRVVAGLMAAFTAYGALPKLEDGTDDESALVTQEESEYVEYLEDDLVKDLTKAFTGIEVDEDGLPFGYFVFGSLPHGVVNRWEYRGGRIGAYIDGEYYRFRLELGWSRRTFVNGVESTYIDGNNLSTSYRVSPSELMSTNMPIFASYADFSAFFENGDTSLITNYVDTSTVSVFYESTPTCTVPQYVINFMTKSPSAEDVKDLAATLSVLPTDTAGTSQYIPTIEQVVQEATDALPDASTGTEEELLPTAAPEEIPEEDVEQEQDPDTGNFNYFNILELILKAIKGIASTVWSFFENPLTSIGIGITNLIELVPNCFELVRGWIEAIPSSVYGFFEAPLLDIQEGLAALNPFESWWPRLQPYLDRFLALFQSAVPEPDLTDPDIPSEDEGGNGKHSLDILNLLNGLWLLIMIILILLSIFLHLMIFIINIFKIPATTGYLNENMIMGLNYIKTLEITGIGLSVYDFMMGLVYILMVFGVVKVLRHNINHIKVPKAIKGGLYR